MTSNQVILKTQFIFETERCSPFVESNKTIFENDLKLFLILKGKAFTIKLCFQKLFFKTTFWKLDFWKLIFIFADKIFPQEFCLVNQLQIILKAKLIFERVLAPVVKSKRL